MKKIYIISLGINVLLGLSAYGQNVKSYVDKSNCRDGESVEYCHTHKKLQELMKNPAAAKSIAESNEIQNQLLKSAKVNGGGIEKGTIYKIPVVFHVLHNGGAENISREQILDALASLNRDFRRLNTDANTVVATFQGMPSDIEIEFVLATKAPNGTCFNGITRTKSPLTTDLGTDANGNDLDNVDGTDQVNAIKAGNDVYQGEWPGNKYMNVFICKSIHGAAGYTYNPSNWMGNSMGNGIWLLHDYTGSIGTSEIYHDRTLTHETGHWLNLSHTWGDNNNPGDPSSCDIDDHVDDTPVTIGMTSCNLNANTCDDTNTAQGVTSSWQTDVVDNVENYMDYSYCSKMYTPGQKARMRAAIISNVGGRNNLWTTNNLNATGANGNLTLCKADFELSKTVICAGETITLTDASYNTATSWNWVTTGGTPATSTAQNPVITYNTPGIYTVTLTATSGGTSLTETKTQVIKVFPVASSLPFYDGFETYTSLSTTNNWAVKDDGQNNPFTLVNGVGHTGQKCVKLSNFDETVNGTIDELISSPVNLDPLTNSNTVTLTYRYSYRKKTSTSSEFLRVLVSTDCSETWNVVNTVAGNTLSNQVSATSWVPSSQNDWKTVHITSITYPYFKPDFRYKFQFTAAGGNNLYIDDINMYLGAPSNTIVLGLEEQASIVNDLELYPNPSEGELNVNFTVPTNQNVTLKIQDVSGKIAQTELIKANEGSNLVVLNTEKLSSGLYFLNVQSGSTQKTMQFVVK
jgi:PKD repeat protein